MILPATIFAVTIALGSTTGAPITDDDSPKVSDRRLVAYVATGTTVVAVGAGVVAGLLAQQQYGCLNDIVACNAQKTGSAKIIGSEFFDARSQMEATALAADASFVVAGAAAITAGFSWVTGFLVPSPDERP